MTIDQRQSSAPRLLRDHPLASSLPFVRGWLRTPVGRRVGARQVGGRYSDAFQLMPSGGAIIQYTYGLRPPVDPWAAALKLEATCVAREWRNFPPMGIWRYSRAG